MALSRFGYCLGRLVYLLDAVDDLEEDLHSGSYNAIVLSKSLTKETTDLQAARETAQLALNGSLAECKAAYELLTVHRFDGIIRNVLEWGLPMIQKQVISGKNEKRSSRGNGGFKYEKSL